MDWQARLTQARERHEDLTNRIERQDEAFQEVISAHQEARAALVLAKHNVEGQMSIIGEVLQDQQQDTLQDMIAGKTPEQALALLNGVEQRLHEQTQSDA